MCVAVPGRVVSIGSQMPGAVMGQVEFGDRTLEINLIMVPDIEVGDHVLVHSGYAIRTVSREVATRVTETLLTGQPAER
jgi:hydrogenase expression/formation protein HypC